MRDQVVQAVDVGADHRVAVGEVGGAARRQAAGDVGERAVDLGLGVAEQALEAMRLPGGGRRWRPAASPAAKAAARRRRIIFAPRPGVSAAILAARRPASDERLPIVRRNFTAWGGSC